MSESAALAPHPACVSPYVAPEGLLDADYAYGVLDCGFVVRAPREPYLRGRSRELQEAMWTHVRNEHARLRREMEINRAMSAD